MTATPRIFTDTAKDSAERDNTTLCSMNDPKLFGPQLSVLTFSESVKHGLLVDYKVVVLAIQESDVNRRLEQYFKDGANEIPVHDAAKIIGCWKALSKQGLNEQLRGDNSPMQRAVAFCQVIDVSTGAKVHKVASKQIAKTFQEVIDAYVSSQEPGSETSRLVCQSDHIDGTMNASTKTQKINWLKEQPPENTCRILSNVRCLSEGVDVPALDAVLFLHPRGSQIDVVQSVGRVMRTSPGKNRGYVILPVVIPAGIPPHEALNDNVTYKVVWQVLQALRSHDDGFDAMINKFDLGYADLTKMEVIARIDELPRRPRDKSQDNKPGAGTIIGKAPKPPKKQSELLPLDGEDIEKAIFAKIVKKVGNKGHWEEWATDVGRIARSHIDRITGILENKANKKEREAFERFAKETRQDLNDSVSDAEIVEMLGQHLVTKPVFEALFSDHSFAKENPVSQSMQAILNLLGAHHLDRENDTLSEFYDSVKVRAAGIPDGPGKQKIILELYEKFFKNAFPKTAERLGI